MRVQGDFISMNPQFNKESWDDVEFIWNNKPFIRSSVPEVLHLPIVDSIETVNQTLLHKALRLNAIPDDNEALILRHPISAWKEEVLLSVTHPVADNDYVEISGTFRSKVFEGKKSQLRSFLRQMNEFLTFRNERAVTYYINRVEPTSHEKKEEMHTYVIIAQVANLDTTSQPYDVDRWFPNMLYDA
jgi:hypothetical protein